MTQNQLFRKKGDKLQGVGRAQDEKKPLLVPTHASFRIVIWFVI